MALFGEEKLAELEAFVTLARNDPSILHKQELSFFKEYLLSLGAKIPDPLAEEPKEESEEEPFHVESLNDEEVVAPESTPPPALAPAGEKELTDDDYEKLSKAKEAAAEALEAGDLNKAVESYTKALLVGNPTALLYTRRAEVLFKQKRYAAAVRDCDEALKLNPDNARAYRIRGTSNRYLGNWKQAHSDIEMGQKIDYDENIWDIQKLVEQKYKIIEEHERSVQRRREEKERREREKRIREQRASSQKAYEEQKKREASGVPGGFPGGMPGGFPGEMSGGYPGGAPGGMSGSMPGGIPGGVPGGMPGGMGGLGGLLGSVNDPDVQQVFSNPKMMAAFQDILTNPGNMAKYKDDPEVADAISKLMRKFGGGMAGGSGIPH
ncbi:58 kDa phosphoprotein, putative [Eimeria tenella]|uniref:58 kDa phosphoprotein, putative n=1 Tax=Eimeria tenella TaxID=5802 RepID=U6KWM1_EIMTE|nr:58 kDa phosphoprotein, putative [Eimeria tenella]CDJ42517.1 58 kDa phosphoprotein, putative [Eimeria tenella]|eukprot:XP_013233267.1 58 kDa phosphoprotein, putative [Eimeria tenella]